MGSEDAPPPQSESVDRWLVGVRSTSRPAGFICVPVTKTLSPMTMEGLLAMRSPLGVGVGVYVGVGVWMGFGVCVGVGVGVTVGV